MSPQTVQQSQAPQDNLEWVHIDDFSPGIYDPSYTTYIGSAPSGAPITPAPLGAASPENTWGCASLLGGGLGPLPGVTATHNYTAWPGTTTFMLNAGFIVNPGLANYGGNEVISILEGDDGAHRYYQAWSTVPGNAYAVNSIGGASYTVASTTGFFGAPYPVWTRMNVSGTVTPGTPGPPPVLVWPSSDDNTAAGGHLWVYPEILSPSSFVAQDIVGSSVTGQTIAYGSRIITLVGNSYTWPVTGGIGTNENINFTDPPNSSTYGSQYTWLTSEIPWGYGAWGSVSVGELLLVKKQGGAVILYGDIKTPTSAIVVPGVQSTGDIVGSASATPQGLVYCSERRGAWLWNGGNTATKISSHIADDFFDLETNVIQSNNYGFFVAHWQNWFLFSGNWLYNSEQNNWWILYPTPAQSASNPIGDHLFWYSPGAFGSQMFAAPLILNKVAGSATWWYQFDSTFPATKYLWQSAVIHVGQGEDRVLDIRQVVIRASQPDGDPNSLVAINLGSINGWGTSVPVGANTNPVSFRLNVGPQEGGSGPASGVQGVFDIVVLLGGNNTNNHSAPIIHSVDIGYQIRQKVVSSS